METGKLKYLWPVGRLCSSVEQLLSGRRSGLRLKGLES